MNRQTLISLLVLVSIVILACGGSAVPTVTSSSSQPIVIIQFTGDEIAEITTEGISQPNCNGTSDVENLVERSHAIEHILETSAEFSVNADGQIGISGTDIGIGASVAAQLGTSYGSTETVTKSLTVKAGPGSNMTQTIRQTEVWKVGNAKVVINGKENIIPFRFRNDFSVELVSSENEGCDGQSISPTATEASIQDTPIPTNTSAVISNTAIKTVEINLTMNSTNYDGKVIFTLEKIDVLGNQRMRWYVSFWNQDDSYASMAFGWDAPYSYAVDEFGTKYSILAMQPSEFIATGIPAGTKSSGWLEFDAPANQATSFKLFLVRYTFGSHQVRYDNPLEFSLNEPIVP